MSRSRRSARVSVLWLTHSKCTATICASGASRASVDDVVVVHHDRVALVEPRGAGVDDDDVGGVGGDRVADLVAEDRVAGDVDRRLRGRGQHEAGHRRHLLADLARAVPALGALRSGCRDASRRRARGGRAVKPSACRRSVSGGWQKSGRCLSSSRFAVSSKWSRCRCVTSSGVEAGDDRLGRLRELAERAAARVGRVRDGLAGARGVELRVDEQRLARVLDPERRGADQGQLHALHTCTGSPQDPSPVRIRR